MRFRFSVLLPFALSLISLTAAAAPSTLGKQRYEEGERAFNARRWDEARRAFSEAYELDREPELLYDVALATWRAAQASHDVADLRAARAAYRRYLEAAPAGRSRAQAESSVRTIDGLLPAEPPSSAGGSPGGTSASTSSEPAASSSGAPSHASSAAAPSSSGSHTPSSEPASHASSAAPAHSAAAHTTSARADLTHPAPARTPLYKRWWLWTTVGVVAAGAGVGLYFGLTANHFAPTLPDFGPGSNGAAATAVRP